jgi:hypothetical protein
LNHYEAKQEARRERLEARAERLQREAAGAFKRADLSEAATGIPFGQPILVGHHSERRHRAVIARAHAAMGRGVALSKEAAAVEARAAGVGLGGISSDDPDAVSKLKAELAEHEAKHAQELAINAAIKKNWSAGHEAQVAAIVALGYSEDLAEKLLVPPYPRLPRLVGIPAYRFSNRSANMRRIKKRIAHLERIEAERAPLIEAGIDKIEREGAGGLVVVENIEANRLQLKFPGKPAPAIIAALKASGFRWAPSEGAWQRHLGRNTTWAAERIEGLLAATCDA